MRKVLILVCLILAVSTPAYAITAGDVLDKMSEDRKNGYITGAIDMAMYKAGAERKGEKAECILNWYYRGDGRAQRQVAAAFAQHRELPAVGILKVLIERECGK